MPKISGGSYTSNVLITFEQETQYDHMNILQIEKTIEVSTGIISLIDENIFYIKYNSNITLDVDDFKEIDLNYSKLNETKNLKILVEFQKHTNFTVEARNHAEKYPVDSLAEAIIFRGLAQRMMVRFYLLVNKQDHPVKIFEDKQQAVDWLNSF